VLLPTRICVGKRPKVDGWPKVDVTTSDASVGSVGKKRRVEHEASRSQYLCRTGGKGPGSSHKFQYWPKSDLSKEEAKRKAEEWISKCN